MADAAMQFTILWHVVLAMFLGAALGFEREAADRPAGLRTHMLVAGMAALVVLLGELVIERVTLDVGFDLVGSDPLRLIDAVITGVSFLGAGTIFRRTQEDYVEGLTTAASLLFTAAIGITVALDQLLVALGLVVLSLLVLQGMRPVQALLDRKTEDDDAGDV